MDRDNNTKTRTGNHPQTKGKTQKRFLTPLIIQSHNKRLCCLVWAIAVIAVLCGSCNIVHYHKRCHKCGYDRYISEYRLFGMRLGARIGYERPTLIYQASVYLGVPCEHDFSEIIRTCRHGPFRKNFWKRHDFPDMQTLVRFEDEIVEKMKAAVMNNPGLAEDFRARVLQRCDGLFWPRLLKELKDPNLAQIATQGSSLSTLEIQTIVNKHIGMVEQVDMTYWRPHEPDDEHAEIILALGEHATPILIKKLLETDASQMSSWATIGDVAHILLSRVHTRVWPTPKFEKRFDIDHDDFLRYHRTYLSTDDKQYNRENRRRLYEAWLQGYQEKFLGEI